jgi:hypothetical protein
VRDFEVRGALTARLSAKYTADDGRLVHELAIPQHSARVDLAWISASLTGFEIKSGADTLQRLPAQQLAYGRVFDRMYLALESCHLERALSVIPNWWGVLELRSTRNGPRWIERRRSRLNPQVDIHSVVQLLWRSEVVDELRAVGIERGVASAPKSVLWTRLAEAAPERISTSALKARVRSRLRLREGWRAD